MSSTCWLIDEGAVTMFVFVKCNMSC